MTEDDRSRSGAELDRLPPPAFPPDARRPEGARPLPRRPRRSGEGGEGPGGRGEGASTPGYLPPEALILPDEPFPSRQAARSGDEGVATGIGNDPHLAAPVPAARRETEADLRRRIETDPHLRRLVRSVDSLARSLRERGEEGLRTTDEMTRIELVLRAYCVGWLAARRDAETT